MMYGDWKDEEHSGRGVDTPRTAARACPACGALRRRDDAHFCATCGRALDGGGEGGYFPSDSLRASYHLQSRRGAATLKSRLRQQSAPAPSRRAAGDAKTNLFMENRNGASTTALAFVTYALVPYLGILFCPGALLLGGVGLLRSFRSPHLGGQRASVMSIALGVVIFVAQILLWWILYKVPEWSRHAPWAF